MEVIQKLPSTNSVEGQLVVKCVESPTHKNSYNIQFENYSYQINLNDQFFNQNQVLQQITKEFPNIQELILLKKKTLDPNIEKVAAHRQFTKIEYFIKKLSGMQQLQSKKILKLEEEKCSICQNEIFEAVEKSTYDDLVQQLKKSSSSDDCIELSKCFDHYFHIDCISQCIPKDTKQPFLKCPNCQMIYGVMTGDQPEGSFSSQIANNIQCQGYNCGTIIITYHMKSGMKNGKHYDGTKRVAYLPNNKEGQEVFYLLQKAFHRKLIFTVGKSVTLGIEPAIIWNGIHHKTSLTGGTSCYGYPDPGYFNRVKQELAAKGID